jgi:hypothetical protein
MLLAATGSAIGVLTAAVMLPPLVRAIPFDVPRLHDAAIDGVTITTIAALTALVGSTSGLLAAAVGLRGLPDVAPTGAGVTPPHHRTHAVFATFQLATAMMMLAASGVLLKSLWLIGASTDVRLPSRVVVADVQTSRTDKATLIDQTIAALDALPGVEAAAWNPGVETAGVQLASDSDRATAGRIEVIRATDGALAASGLRLIAGRWIDRSDARGSEPIAVVNEAWLRRYGIDSPARALQRRVTLLPQQDTVTIVGVVDDFKVRGDVDAGPLIYLSHRQKPFFANTQQLIVRTSSGTAAVMAALRTEAEHTAGVELANVAVLADVMRAAIAPRRFEGLLIALFAALAVLLALVGVHGVLTYWVREQTQAFAVRFALGATRGHVLRLVLRRGFWIVGCGIVAGLASGPLIARLLRGLVYGVSPADPVVFIAVCATLGGAALVTALLAARRALTVDPVITLRYE